MNAEDRFSELYRVAQFAARKVRSDFADVDDLTQEAMLWLLEHPKRVDHALLPDGTLFTQRLASEVIEKSLIPYAQAQERQSSGVEPEVQYLYSARVVEIVLPAVFDRDYRPPFLEQSDRVTTTADPTTADNWTAMVVDVARAVAAVCSTADRQVLFSRSVGGWTWDRFAAVYTMSSETYRLRYHDALRRIVLFLNAGEVADSSEDGELLADAMAHGVSPQRRPMRTDWDVAGRDPYREPDI